MTSSRTSDELVKYAQFISGIIPNIDKHAITQLAQAAIKYYSGSSEQRYELRRLQELERQWYQSLANGQPDYTVYDDPYMLSDVYACWAVYSYKYLRLLQTPNKVAGQSLSFVALTQPHVRGVLDMGCGPAYTTAALKKLYVNANVYGTQLPTSAQWRVAKAMGGIHQFSVIPSPNEITTPIDLVFASEFFEHLLDPYTEIRQVVTRFAPQYFVIANSFNTISVGHFDTYYDGATIVPAKDASRRFNALMRELGYRKMPTKFWNGRPTIWAATR